MTTPWVVAVVVTYNRPNDLERCLSALADQSHQVARTLVIDNASDEPTAQVLTRFPAVEVHRLDANYGSSGGFARGIELASLFDAEWVWVMDDDAVPQPDALERVRSRRQLVNPRQSRWGAER